MITTDPTWHKALTLLERLSVMKAQEVTLPKLSQGTSTVADRRIQRWRSQEPFTEPDFFAQRLAMENLDEEEIRYILAGDVETLVRHSSQPSAWSNSIDQAFGHPIPSDNLSIGANVAHDQDISSLLAVFAPLTSLYRDRLLKGAQELVQTYTHVPFVPLSAEASCWENILPSLIRIVGRTMTLELQIARLQDLLHGDTPEERFHSFIEYISQPERTLNLMKEYPVLARILTTSLEHWVKASLELLERLCSDWEEIVSTLNDNCSDPGVLVKLHASGDSHRKGHTVAILDFSSGFRLVYKPKSLAADENFQALLCWINQHGQRPELRVTRIINRGTYGWCEFLASQPCSSEEEVSRFYQREGSYLALLYVLAATDFHYENIIAVGEHPMLVDYESLFHPFMQADLDQQEETSHTLADSVFSIGLLPQRSWKNTEFAGVNLSGLGSDFHQISSREGAYWMNVGTDEMYLGKKRSPIAANEGQNLPILNGKRISVLEHSDAFFKGFTSTYNLLLQHRADLLASDGPLACFAENELRIIVRPTHIYSLMLRESYHPDMLRDGLERDRFFEKLWKSTTRITTLPPFIPSERADLWNGDIPIFFVQPASHHIWNSAGQRIDNRLRQSGMERVHARLQNLSEADLQWQLWITRASFTALAINASDMSNSKKYPLPESSLVPGHTLQEDALAAARTIGDRLVKLAQRYEQTAYWIGLRAFQERYWDLEALGLDLYAGLPGITLFLAYLGQLTGESCYTELAQDALANIRRQLAVQPDALPSIGAFSGYGGLIYTFTHLAVLWQDPELFTEAEVMVSLVSKLIEKEKNFDLLSGAAGCIGSLLCLYDHQPSEQTLAAMIQCGNHLLKHAQSSEVGIGWITPLSSQPLSGFSHGSAGMAWALLRLASLSHRPDFADAAYATIAYERSLFSVEDQNWRDLRGERSSSYMMAWCHGAVGIGLARLSSLPYLDTIEVREEIHQAIEKTLVAGFGRNHSLCHGDFGNLELLLLASQTLEDEDLRTQTYNLAARLLASIDQYGWLCGVPLNVENPGLMAGLAGIGYELLRLANPEAIPSVLVLESPRHR